MAGARAVGPALAEHQPPDGRRLLGLADPARIRQHQLRHRRRRRTSTRSRASTASSARWTGCASSSRSAPTSSRRTRPSSRTSSRCSTSRTAARASSPPIAGRWSARRASSPIRSIRPDPTSSRWATTTSTDLIVRDARGEDIAARAEAFNATYLRLFDAFIRLYDGQYPIMGNAQVMTAKVAWDNACYWAITALLFFQRRLRAARVHGVDRSADAALLRPARAHAAVPARLGPRRRRQPSTRPPRRTSSTSTSCGVCRPASATPIDGGRGAARAARRQLRAARSASRATWQAIAAERHPGARPRFVVAGGRGDAARCRCAAPDAAGGRCRQSVAARLRRSHHDRRVVAAETRATSTRAQRTALLARLVGDDVDGAVARRSRRGGSSAGSRRARR